MASCPQPSRCRSGETRRNRVHHGSVRQRPSIHPLAQKVANQIDGRILAAAVFNPNVLLGTPGGGLASMVALVNWRRKAKAVRRGEVRTDNASLLLVTPTSVYLYEYGWLKALGLPVLVGSWLRSSITARPVELKHPFDPSGRPDPRSWSALRLEDSAGDLICELQPETWELDAKLVYRELTGQASSEHD